MVFSVHFSLLAEKEAEVLMDLHKGLLKAMSEEKSKPAPCGNNSQEDITASGAAAGAETVSSPAPESGAGAGGDAKGHTSTPVHGHRSKDKPGSGSSGSENGFALGVHGGGVNTLVDIPST